MLRALFRVLFGLRDDKAKPSSQPPMAARPSWREAPTRTDTNDLGHGIVATLTYQTGHHGFVQVVGESHYQDALRTLAGRIGSDGVFTARLVPEPDNPHDPRAVAVCVDGDLAKIGHLARDVAKVYHSLVAAR